MQASIAITERAGREEALYRAFMSGSLSGSGWVDFAFLPVQTGKASQTGHPQGRTFRIQKRRLFEDLL